ncbi:hypothetical protein G7Z17_g8707 [Cylindrodendrum hubeiense]|uniref:COP9 signalosome complex subunit 2 n=1 Tax=Cylindrodendrum hubeiense TaxID=595255 RepID=A0A9P5H319_9HYPO|nr:hypothetical protein G7Z17_g8707 [Cylindrodendrum hubeiense]
MSSAELRQEDDWMDSDVESEGANLIQAESTENSPLLPNDLPADILPPKSFRRRVLIMCILFLFIVEVSQFIMEAPLQTIMEDIICRNYYPDHLLRAPRIQDHRCKSNDVQKTLAMVRGWSLAFEMATRSLFYLIGGGGAMVGAMVWTIVADVVPVVDRTSVFYQIMAVVLMINVVVNPISAWFIQFDPWIPMWLSFGFAVVGTGCSLFIPETLTLRRKADDRRRNSVTHESGHPEHTGDGNNKFKHHVLQQAWFTVKNDMGHVWRFIFASKSIMLLIVALSAFLPIRLAFSNILLQYMTKRFNWEWSTATYIITAGILATVVALLIILPLASVLITKRYNYGPLQRDLFLSRISSLFLVSGVLLMTVAAAPWLFVTSLVITSLGNGFSTLCRALLNAVVEPHTVATLNTTISLVEMLIALISGPAMGWLLSEGMDLGGAWQGLPFLVLTALAIGMTAAVFVFKIPTGVAQYDFEYEEDDDEDSGDVDIENKYYNAKQMKLSDPEDAVAEFLGIPPLEDEKGEWGFKGLKQAIKLEYKLAQYDKAAEHYAELLTYVKSAVTRNYSEKSINNMLDYIEKGADGADAIRCMEQFYSLTLQSFQSTNNERLWLKTNIKLAKLLLDRKEYAAVSKKLRELHKTCQREDGSDDPSKGTYSLEIYALEIQMFAETKNNKQLKALYQRALKVKSAVPHPRIMGIIRECGGKMHMSEENWKEAQSDFFESFRNYDEAGSLQRIQVLKYLLLTTMLMKSNINPFDSQETKPYKTDPRISAMTELVDAYQRDDVHTYEKVLGRNQDILDDSFIAENIDEVTRNMRTKGVVKLIAPYTRMKLAWIAKQLKISEPEVQDILGFLIIDGKISGRINQQEGLLEITSDADSERILALQGLTTSISELFGTIFRDGDGFRNIENSSAEDQGVDIQGIPIGKGSGGRGPALRGKKGKGIAPGWA